MTLHFYFSTFNQAIQDLIRYYIDVLKFCYGDILIGAHLYVHAVTKRVLTLNLTIEEGVELDPTETFIGLHPLSDRQFLFQILIPS